MDSFAANFLVTESKSPFCKASGLKKVCRYSICSFRLVSDNEISICPDSTFEILIMSLMMFSIRTPLFSIILTYSCCSSPARFGDFNSSVKPRMPFIGVRISWLILARKASFNRSLSSAFSLAFISSFSAFLRSVMSSVIAIKCVVLPFILSIGEIVADSQNNPPSFFTL